MQKTKHAPWSFVGNCRINRREHQRVDCNESMQPVAPFVECLCKSDKRKCQDQAFGPPGPFGWMKPCEALQIKTPWMQMRRVATGAFEPGEICAHRTGLPRT